MRTTQEDTKGKERLRAKPAWWRAAAAGTLLFGLVGCQQLPVPPGDGGGATASSGTDAGAGAAPGSSGGEGPDDPGVVAGSSVSAAIGQTCTDAWRRQGHTTQREAKAFLTRCLAEQGVEGQRLDAASVLALLEPAIPADSALTALVPADVTTFCPAYAQQDAEGRASFWRRLVLAMVGPESGFSTTASLWEGGGLQQFSIGLLQLSYTDRANHGCDFANEADIADPARNLACGVRIMTRLVGENGAIGARSGDRWLGGARYWSVLRTTSDARAGIIRATSSLPACQME